VKQLIINKLQLRSAQIRGYSNNERYLVPNREQTASDEQYKSTVFNADDCWKYNNLTVLYNCVVNERI